jgi:hypothetical protein
MGLAKGLSKKGEMKAIHLPLFEFGLNLVFELGAWTWHLS